MITMMPTRNCGVAARPNRAQRHVVDAVHGPGDFPIAGVESVVSRVKIKVMLMPALAHWQWQPQQRSTHRTEAIEELAPPKNSRSLPQGRKTATPGYKSKK
jgi:hypothetical protein